MKKKYRITTYLTTRGECEFVDLGDFSFGEWIVCEGGFPKFYIDIFKENSESDLRIKNLIEVENQTVESILEQINLQFGQ